MEKGEVHLLDVSIVPSQTVQIIRRICYISWDDDRFTDLFAYLDLIIHEIPVTVDGLNKTGLV